MQHRWFWYTVDDGFNLATSEGEARLTAARALEDYAYDAQADGEWPEGVESICWGRIIEHTEATEYEVEEYGEQRTATEYTLARLPEPQPPTVAALLDVLGDLATDDDGAPLRVCYGIDLDHGDAPMEVALRAWVAAGMPGRQP